MRSRTRFWAAFALAVAVFAGLSISPAAASHEAHGVSLCSPLPLKGQNVFGLRTFAGASSAARGEPGGMSGDAAFVGTPKARKTFGTITVPVYFHVLRASLSRDEGNVRLSTISRQMDVLNRAYAGGYGGAATPFVFELVSVDYTTNAEWFNLGYNSPAEREAKAALRQGGPNALNIYSGTAGGYLGWATWPWLVREHPERDGIVIDFESMPGGEYGSEFGLGHTATHEAGHWFGLYHTFQGGCSESGDGVEDTPREFVPTSGCPEGKDTCTRHPGLDPIHNYMDYSFDSCYEEFSQGQVDRMVGFFTQYRA